MRVKGEFKIESLAFVAFLLTVPFYSPNLVPINALDAADAYLPLFVNTLLPAVAVIALVVAAWSFRRDARGDQHPVIVAAASVIYLAGFIVLGAGMYADWSPSATALVAAVLCALGVVFVALAWGRYFSAFTLRQALVHAAVLGGIAALGGLMIASLSGAVLVVVILMLLVAGCGVPVVRAYLKLDQAALPDAPRTASTPGMLRNFLSVSGESLVGLLLFAFIMGVRKLVVFDAFYAENIGGIVAAALVVPLLLKRGDGPLISYAFRWYLPVCALVLIVLDSFPVGSMPNTVGAFGIYAFLTLVALVAGASLVAAAHAREFSSTFVFALLLGTFCAVSFVGVLVGALPVVSDDPGPLLLVLSTAYLAFLLLAAVRSAREQAVGALDDRGAGHAQPLGSDAVERRCAGLAAQADLSPRETEILQFLGRGYAPAYIARTLVLSESTVRTHVRHIYQKLEVTSREQCLDLVNDQACKASE